VFLCERLEVSVDDLAPPGDSAVEVADHSFVLARRLEPLLLVAQLRVLQVALAAPLLLLRSAILQLLDATTTNTEEETITHTIRAQHNGGGQADVR